MKALIQKELRENSRVAVLGLVVFGLMLVEVLHSYSGIIAQLAWQNSYISNYQDKLQPLIGSNTLQECLFFCAAFGAILGFLQIHSERHRDLWAFLVHRPTCRSTIFLSKMIAGASLYLLVSGVPWICFVVWISIPGHVAAPFEWGMVLPGIARILTGLVFYLAGMMTGLRQARWYASRGLGLGLAILVAAGLMAELPLWAAMLIVIVCVAVLGGAVWGAFLTHGRYEGQPVAGRLALIATITPGVAVVAFLAVALASYLLSSNSYSWSYYSVTREGKIYRVDSSNESAPRIIDLEGKPLIDPKTGEMMRMEEFNKMMAPGYSLFVDFDASSRPHRNLNREFFGVWRAAPNALWFYWNRYHRLAVYDDKTRRLIGSLGPKGFLSQSMNGMDQFDPPAQFNWWSPTSVLKTATDVYHVDLEKMTARAIATTTGDDPFGGALEIQRGLTEHNSTVLFATRRFIKMVTEVGEEVWSLPYNPAYPDYDSVQVSVLSSNNEYVVQLSPSWLRNLKKPQKLPTKVFWVSHERGLAKSDVLPQLPDRGGFDLAEKAMMLVAPPALLTVIKLTSDPALPSTLTTTIVMLTIAVSVLVCVPVGWWLGSRSSMPVGARIGWAIFHLMLGFAGFLAFLCVQEWPAREVCSNCDKLRVVNRENCEHCGATFPPPEKIGIEVFEKPAPPEAQAVHA